jgi:hypothetical protein
MITITTRSLQSVQPKPVPYFIRDDKVKGFAAKINPPGSVQLIAEVRYKGRTVRKTIGQHPHIDVKVLYKIVHKLKYGIAPCGELDHGGKLGTLPIFLKAPERILPAS